MTPDEEWPAVAQPDTAMLSTTAAVANEIFMEVPGPS
jgi:hypothetical protein